jgi:hypothetical protein
MIKTVRARAKWMLVGAAAALVAGIGGVAFGAIPGSGGVINGCYLKQTGILRVIDAEAGKKCLSFETPISWNQQGVKGDPGLAGAKGDKGDKGDPGTPAPLYTAGRGLELSGTEFRLAFDPAQIAHLEQELDGIKAQNNKLSSDLSLQGVTLSQLRQLVTSVSDALNMQGGALGQLLQDVGLLEGQMNDVKARLDQLKTHVCGIDPKGPAC